MERYLVFSHKSAQHSIPIPPHIPDRIACICMNGALCIGEKPGRLLLSPAGITGFRSLNFCLTICARRSKPYDASGPDAKSSVSKGSGYILPILSATRMRGNTASSKGALSPEIPPRPVISILMSIHNMKDTLGWSIRSVLAQSSDKWGANRR